ncbi:TetR/AcrR family transcriptional regulator [Novosphingobium sp. 1949]|uniref:TetR/AcrR family transcriptional regulator n=1 Tax=Novosphingobium organovorum TaxID=2930092 RepID=A0ABT0BI40_9SPHN|nr:TetR/AcrR family transcriptional regulator [Novosphingobium organovorum]MCJ2184394.1 TetR/AcrR family transcriptional regulator [Novosphingobium organovorum]
MRVKTDARREAIVAVATELFREVGYERASMAEIATRVGGSKATLYNYFKSKDDLFAASMLDAIEESGQAIIAMLDPSDDDVAAVLYRFGEAFLTLITRADTLAITRTAISEGGNGKLGAALYEHGPRRAWGEVHQYIVQLQARQLLRPIAPQIIVRHFKGMLEADLLEPLLWGARSDLDLGEAARTAVDALLRAYGTDSAEPGRTAP